MLLHVLANTYVVGPFNCRHSCAQSLIWLKWLSKYSCGYIMLFYGGFNFHLFDDWWCWAVFSHTCPFVCILCKTSVLGAFLVVQWLRIHLAVQGTLVRPLAQEDFICCGQLSLWLQLLSLCSRTREPPLLSPCTAATEACVPPACAPQQEQPCN